VITDINQDGSIEKDEYREMFRRLYKCVAEKDGSNLQEIDTLCAEVSK
jgi:hypothetical protein